jgi:hypothetical protein
MTNERDATVAILARDVTKAATDSAGRNFDQLGRKVDAVGRSADTFSSKMANGLRSLQGPATVAGVALAAFGGFAINAASDAEQSIGATSTVFGSFADEIVRKSNEAATAVGLSANAYRESANVLGALLANQGLTGERLAQTTEQLITTGADLSAVFGGTAQEAVEALSSALKGEFDPVERYGISLNAAAIQARALTEAGVDSISAFNRLTPAQQNAAKSAATLAIINEQAARTSGQFAAQQDSTAERAQIARAQFENISATFGEKLLPAVNKILEVGVKVLDWMDKNKPVVLTLAIGIGVLTIAVWAMNAAWLASPVTWIILAIAALAAGIVWVATRTTFFQDTWDAVWGFLKAVGAWFAGPFVDFFVGAFNFIVDALFTIYVKPWLLAWEGIKIAGKAVADFFVNTIWHDGLEKAFRWIGEKAEATFNFFRDLPGKIRSWLGGLAEMVGNIFKGVLNGVIGILNSAIDFINEKLIDTANRVPFVDIPHIPHIPTLHSGGVFHAPPGQTEGLALLQDGERVIPAGEAGSGGGNTYYVSVSVQGLQELEDFKKFLDELPNIERQEVMV